MAMERACIQILFGSLTAASVKSEPIVAECDTIQLRSFDIFLNSPIMGILYLKNMNHLLQPTGNNKYTPLIVTKVVKITISVSP